MSRSRCERAVADVVEYRSLVSFRELSIAEELEADAS